MRVIRTVGLAAAAAMAAIALGASGASASTSIALCGTDGLTCESPITHLHDVATNLKLLTNITTVTCLTGLFLGDVLSANGLASLWLVITGRFTYNIHCLTSNGATCEVEELGGPMTIQVMKLTGVEKTLVEVEGEVLVNCSTTPHCVYNGEGAAPHGLGPLPAGGTGETSWEEVTLHEVSGLFCPGLSKLDALFKPLSATYISS